MNKKTSPSSFHPKPQMQNNNFQIYYNKDKSLQKIDSHVHKYYEFYFLISGDITYTIDERNYHLKAGDVILIHPNQYHRASINTNINVAYERYVLWLHPKYLKDLSSPKTDLLFPFQKINLTSSHIPLTRDIQMLVNNLLQMILIHSNSHEYGSDLLTNCYIIELLVHIAKVKLFQQTIYFEKDFGNNPIVLSALNYITEHIGEDIKVKDITDYLYVSRSYLSKLFSSTMGLSIHQYIIKKKLYLAKQELLSGSSINNIYQKYGFGNYSSFFRAFKNEFGLSPRSLLKAEKQIID